MSLSITLWCSYKVGSFSFNALMKLVESSFIGVHQSMLETVVPKTQNAAVMIVGGKRHRREVCMCINNTEKMHMYGVVY